MNETAGRTGTLCFPIFAPDHSTDESCRWSLKGENGAPKFVSYQSRTLHFL